MYEENDLNQELLLFNVEIFHTLPALYVNKEYACGLHEDAK